MQLRKLWQRMAVLLVMAMLAAACGDNGDAGGEAAPDAGATGGAVTEEDAPATTPEERATGDQGGGSGDGEPLTLGHILPETGSLAFLGPPMIQAVGFAVDRINSAGGVLGSEIPAPVAGDEADDAAIANQSADRLLAENVDVVIGAAASGMSLAIIDKVTGAGIVQCSGSNTAPTFTDYDDGGFYFRTAPTDALQGPVLAETIIADGAQNVALLGRADDYGRGLVDATQQALSEAGATTTPVIYDQNAQNFDAYVEEALAGNPDAVVVVAFEEGAQIIQDLLEAGITPDQLYGTDGDRTSELPQLVNPNDPNVLDGMTGTAPAPEIDEQFISEFTEASGLTDTTFAPQVYDCVNVVALGAEAAGSTDPAAFVEQIVEVTREGTACTSFEECRDLIANGEDIDYNGASGPLDFTDDGEPGVGTYEVWTFQDGGQLTSMDVVEATLPES